MPNFAILAGNTDYAVITNLIVSDSLEDATETMKFHNLGNFCLPYGPELGTGMPNTNWLWVKDKFISREEYAEKNADIQV